MRNGECSSRWPALAHHFSRGRRCTPGLITRVANGRDDARHELLWNSRYLPPSSRRQFRVALLQMSAKRQHSLSSFIAAVSVCGSERDVLSLQPRLASYWDADKTANRYFEERVPREIRHLWRQPGTYLVRENAQSLEEFLRLSFITY